MGLIFFKKAQIIKTKIIGKEMTATKFGKLDSRTGVIDSAHPRKISFSQQQGKPLSNLLSM